MPYPDNYTPSPSIDDLPIPDLDFNGDVNIDVEDANGDVQHFEGKANMLIKLEGSFA